MFRFKAGPDRWKLGFKEAVLRHFTFLHKYGFQPVHAETTFVRYETGGLSSKKLFVNVYHGRGSYEMGVEIGQGREGGVTLPLPWIVKWAGAREAEDFERRTMFQVSSREGVRDLMPEMAELVRKYADPFLRGNEEAYARARKQMQREGVLYAKEVRLRHAREKAEAAWHDKDYAQVVNVYEPFKEDLSRSEAMRLEYAKKQVLRPAKAPGKR